MISTSQIDKDAAYQVLNNASPLTQSSLKPVLDGMTCGNYEAGTTVVAEGDQPQLEMLVLRGILCSSVLDENGNEVILNFYPGPCIVSPSISRYSDKGSRISLTALTDARCGSFSAELLIQCMINDPQVQHWGDTVLRMDLIKRADKEWAMAALSASKRLERFREQFGDLEERINHQAIASYLGITPVTLSRLRHG